MIYNELKTYKLYYLSQNDAMDIKGEISNYHETIKSLKDETQKQLEAFTQIEPKKIDTIKKQFKIKKNYITKYTRTKI